MKGPSSFSGHEDRGKREGQPSPKQPKNVTYYFSWNSSFTGGTLAQPQSFVNIVEPVG